MRLLTSAHPTFKRRCGLQYQAHAGLFNHRHKASLDIFWLKDESLSEPENLPPADVIAQEIAEDLEAALGQIQEILSDLGPQPRVPSKLPSGYRRMCGIRTPCFCAMVYLNETAVFYSLPMRLTL